MTSSRTHRGGLYLIHVKAKLRTIHCHDKYISIFQQLETEIKYTNYIFTYHKNSMSSKNDQNTCTTDKLKK